MRACVSVCASVFVRVRGVQREGGKGAPFHTRPPHQDPQASSWNRPTAQSPNCPTKSMRLVPAPGFHITGPTPPPTTRGVGFTTSSLHEPPSFPVFCRPGMGLVPAPGFASQGQRPPPPPPTKGVGVHRDGVELHQLERSGVREHQLRGVLHLHASKQGSPDSSSEFG